MRGFLASFTVVILTAVSAHGQQLAPQPTSPPTASQQQSALQTQPTQPTQPGVQPLALPQPLPAQAPPGFTLNKIQEGYLNTVLNAWELESGKVTTFSCPFERWEYDPAFGPQIPGQKIPLNKNEGELSYQKPDKGSFQITKTKVFQMPPAKAGQQPAQGDWFEQPNAIGEHWVCDGKSVFEYRHDQKQLVERPIPPQLQGKSIADGPLPFLFGAEADKLKAKYWLRIEEANKDQNVIWIVAAPRFQEQAADFSRIDVMLDRHKMLPTAMRVSMPNNSEHLYLFKLPEAKVNAALARLGAMIFGRPRVPFGYKLVVEEAPMQQAAQPAAPAR